jgi:hypothetical protein
MRVRKACQLSPSSAPRGKAYDTSQSGGTYKDNKGNQRASIAPSDHSSRVIRFECLAIQDLQRQIGRKRERRKSHERVANRA